LSLADIGKLKSDGRSFSCSDCKDSIKKLRRCSEDREDFTAEDGSFWPIQISQGGELFGFCPGKATWDIEVVSIFRLLIVCAETGNINLINGSITEQPSWWIEVISWFVPLYKQIQFGQRVKMILGDGKAANVKSPKPARGK
jgi:hypothetical protein